MNKETKHTPAPLSEAQISQEHGKEQFWITCELGSLKCPFLMHPAEVAANAKRLVVAWNTHAELVDALEALVKKGEEGLWGAWASNTPAGQVLKRARAALASAKGDA